MNKKIKILVGIGIILLLAALFPIKLSSGIHSGTNDISVSIVKPYGYVYVFDREIAPLPSSHMPFKAIVIGAVTVVVNASDAEKVEFYVDNELKFNDTTAPYEWLWDEKLRPPPMHELKVAGYGGGSTASDEMKVLYVNPFKH